MRPNDDTIREHIEVVIVSFARKARSRCAPEKQVVFFHLPIRDDLTSTTRYALKHGGASPVLGAIPAAPKGLVVASPIDAGDGKPTREHRNRGLTQRSERLQFVALRPLQIREPGDDD